MDTTCAGCGGHVALTLAGPLPACHFCGNAEPLKPETRERVAAVRARVAQRAGKQRHLTGQLVSSAGNAFSGGTVLLITCWLLFGGMAFGLAVHGHDMPFMEFAKGPPKEAELAGEWWVLMGLAIGFPLSIGLWGISIFRLRGLKAGALPLPPAYPGAPPRCRCCGGDLPNGTALRRCRFCDADTLVLGDNYQKSELDLDRSVDKVVSDFDRSLDARLSSAERMMMFSVFTPIVLLLVGPVGGLLAGVTKPELWPVAGGFAVFAVLGLGLLGFRKLPKIEPLACVTLEAKLNVGGTDNQVNAQLHLPIQGKDLRVYNVIGVESGSFEIAMWVGEPGQRPLYHVYKLHSGGNPLTAEEHGKVEAVEWWLPALRASEGVRVETVYVLRQQKGGLRIWRGDAPQLGAVPTWTAGFMDDSPVIYLP